MLRARENIIGASSQNQIQRPREEYNSFSHQNIWERYPNLNVSDFSRNNFEFENARGNSTSSTVRFRKQAVFLLFFHLDGSILFRY